MNFGIYGVTAVCLALRVGFQRLTEGCSDRTREGVSEGEGGSGSGSIIV